MTPNALLFAGLCAWQQWESAGFASVQNNKKIKETEMLTQMAVILIQITRTIIWKLSCMSLFRRNLAVHRWGEARRDGSLLPPMMKSIVAAKCLMLASKIMLIDMKMFGRWWCVLFIFSFFFSLSLPFVWKVCVLVFIDRVVTFSLFNSLNQCVCVAVAKAWYVISHEWLQLDLTTCHRIRRCK